MNVLFGRKRKWTAEIPPVPMCRGEVTLVNSVTDSDEGTDAKGGKVQKNDIDPADCEDDGSPVMKCIIVVFAVLAVVWVVSALEPYVALIATSEGTCRTVAIVLAAVACLAIVFALVFFLVQYIRLPRYIRYRRQDYVGRERRLVEKLWRYLQKTARTDADVLKERIGDIAYEKMHSLLKGDADSCVWLDGFVVFQQELDVQAEKEIGRFARRIGVMTSVMRSRRGDIATVAVLSTAMILRLAKIYNQRMSGYSASRLALRFVVNVFIASQAQGIAGSVASGVGSFVGSACAVAAAALGHPEVAVPVSGGMAVASQALGVGAEFAVNNLLAKKLGGFARVRLHVLVD